MEKVISLSIPTLGEEEKKALCDVIDSGWITMGETVTQFEQVFARLHGAERAVAVNSCTAGLHLCLKAFGIGPEDEVILPSLTFVATSNAVLYVGATPVFLDVQDVSTPIISPEDAEPCCSKNTRAVIVMHYGGYLVDLQAWRSFCDEKGLFLIEDAAHAPAVDGVGQLSDAACFSFFSNKNMSTAEGGMVLARNPEILERIRQLRAHGMTTDTLTRDRGHAYSYDVTALGFNYRLDELRAAMGLVQLARLHDWNATRRKLSTVYRDLLNDHIPQIDIPFNRHHRTAAHLMPVRLPNGQKRTEVMKQLRAAGIHSSIHYPPIHHFTYYRSILPDIKLPQTETFCARELSLPLHPGLTEDDISRVVETLGNILNRS